MNKEKTSVEIRYCIEYKYEDGKYSFYYSRNSNGFKSKKMALSIAEDSINSCRVIEQRKRVIKTFKKGEV